MTKEIRYSPEVDPHIYGVQNGCVTNRHWIQLAKAALDQAGFIPKDINDAFDFLAANAEAHARECECQQCEAFLAVNRIQDAVEIAPK